MEKNKLTQIEKNLIKELKNQGVERETVVNMMNRLRTPEQQQKMMNYLSTTKDKTIPISKAILKSLEIARKN